MVTDSIETLFQHSTNKYLANQVSSNQLRGKQKTNTVNDLDKLSFDFWLQDQYSNIQELCTSKSSKLYFTKKELKDYIESNLLDSLKLVLDEFMESNFHADNYPTITRVDLNEFFKLDNLIILKMKESKDKWNQHIATNRSKDTYDFSKKGVIQIDPVTNQEIKSYSSIAEAKKYLGILGHKADISECCQGERETAYGFKWKFYSNSEENSLF